MQHTALTRGAVAALLTTLLAPAAARGLGTDPDLPAVGRGVLACPSDLAPLGGEDRIEIDPDDATGNGEHDGDNRITIDPDG